MGSAVAFILEKKADLHLDAEQVSSLEALDAEANEAMEPLRAQVREAREARDRDKMPTLMQQMRTADEEWAGKAMALLNDAQKEQAEKMLKERRPRGRRPGGPSA